MNRSGFWRTSSYSETVIEMSSSQSRLPHSHITGASPSGVREALASSMPSLIPRMIASFFAIRASLSLMAGSIASHRPPSSPNLSPCSSTLPPMAMLPKLRTRRIGSQRAGGVDQAAWGRCWSDGAAEDQRHHEDERRHPDEKGALSCFGSERVQHVSFTLHFSFTFHCISDTPKGDVGI